MDSSKKEQKAISYVKDIINNCPLLNAYDIREGDKEMSWDGFIRIHKSSQTHSKSNLEGRVFVQIKGSAKRNLEAETITYPAEVSDLRNYLNDGGAIYIVVYIDPKDRRKIYYETLTVVKLKEYLSKVKSTQKSKSISLKALPLHPDEIETIFINFYTETQKQKGFANLPLYTLKDLKDHHGYKGFSISTTKIGNIPSSFIDRQAPFFENEIYGYALLDGFDIPIPIAERITAIEISHNINEPVTVNGKVFYSGCQVSQNKKDQVTIKIGEVIQYAISTDGKCEFRYNPAKLHRDRLQANKFIQCAISNKSFDIGKIHLRMDMDGVDKFLNSLHCEIASLEKLDTLLKTIHVQEQIDTYSLKPQDYRHINLLYRSIVEKKLLPNLKVKDNGPTIYITPIANLRIKIVIYPVTVDNGPEQYCIEDFFHVKENFLAYKKDPDDDHYYMIPPYLVSTIDEYASVSNIDYENIKTTLQSYLEADKDLYSFVNTALLRMLSAYDMKRNNKRLLNAAEFIAKCLIDCDTPALSMSAKKINFFQVIKRYRTFTEEEENQLMTIKDDVNLDPIGKTAICLLLDDHKSAKFYYKQASQEERSFFNTLPIHRFWNTTK